MGVVIGTIILFSGMLMAAVGFWLNMNTPIQQPMPVIGAAIALVGLTVVLLTV